MENQDVQNNWPALKQKIMEAHPEMTAEDLICEIGKEAELLVSIQKRLGKTEKEIHDWLSLLG